MLVSYYIDCDLGQFGGEWYGNMIDKATLTLFLGSHRYSVVGSGGGINDALQYEIENTNFIF